ncbi:eukaryotic rRNA processing protein EBP2-domain-containing protein [Staphylotrichum tortipilum]|uniref:Eukaryotic rRNA processing protein EBP2-domain-containing protein n=1 Tax=Staphylotrichum tortipilum TaxID=2831512 RepID=A0AAN6MJ26_9PEZI|nr:eukaryotic rRNA processing protein EBP2-domain-containing protein [Staphylotrichum longicolle]
MAKKGATQSPKAGPKPKSTATNNAKAGKQKGDRRKSNEPVAAKVVDANDADDWEDESDEEVAPKTNKRKARDEEPSDDDSDSDGSDDDDEHGGIDLEGIDDSDSESELDSDGGAGEDDDDEDEEEEEIDVDELSAEDEEDEEQIIAGTRVRQTINNKEGLLAALRRFALDTNPKTVPFAFHQSIVSSKKTEDSIPSVDDDLQRELAFMNQSLEAARQARTLLRKEGVPFTRPTDFFAETVRSDETMQKVKAKLVEEATAKKASAEARKQRDLKKFGKQVQVQKQQERAKQKRETLEKINLLKRKRQEGGGAGLGANEADDLFDVAVDNELRSAGGSHNKGGNTKKRSAGDHGPPSAKRQKKDGKYGFGGKKRFGKSGDAMSSGDLSSFNAKRMKSGGGDRGGPRGGPGGGGPGGGGGARKGGAKPRLGKSRRQAQAGRR